MKKILGIFTISIFILSILASVSPELKMKAMNLNDTNKYSATSVPVPRMNNSYNYAEKKVNKEEYIIPNLSHKINAKIKDNRLAE